MNKNAITNSLYRKWRPQTFTDLQGQNSIRDTIYYALTHHQMSQAYLFCGPRGTGKTTTARLIAKVLNCQTDKDHKPCNTCAACISITEGANLDIIEVDAASNRGIDEIRQLRDTVRFPPTQAKYKVFIIDEVHMLTREAFNALLKTLEEPPEYAIFVLATTESHKIPATIISRCQRYDFKRANQEMLQEHLLRVAKSEKINLDLQAAAFLARLSDGSFRDALSLLEQVTTMQAKAYTLQIVEALFGYVPSEQIATCLGAILNGEVSLAHEHIDAILGQGADSKALYDQLLELSQIALESVATGDFKALEPQLARVAQATSLATVVKWTELLLGAINDAKQSPIVRLPLDLAIAKFSTEMKPRPQVVIAQESVESAPVTPSPPLHKPIQTVAATVAEKPIMVAETVAVPVAVATPTEITPDDWRKVLTALREVTPSLVTSLAHGKIIGLESDLLVVAVRYKMHADKINQLANRNKIEPILAAVLGVPLKIEARVVKDLPEEEKVDLSEIFEFEDE